MRAEEGANDAEPMRRPAVQAEQGDKGTAAFAGNCQGYHTQITVVYSAPGKAVSSRSNTPVGETLSLGPLPAGSGPLSRQAA